jgi:hypothetical protein
MAKFLIDILHYFLWPSLLMLVFGIAGNVFLFMIYLRLRKLSVGLYYRVGALFDLVVTLHWLKNFLRVQYGIYIANISSFICKITSFSIYFTSASSSWLQVIISIDRLFHIVYPTKCSLLDNFKFQVAVIFTISGVNFVYFILNLTEMDLIYTTINGTNVTNVVCLFQTDSLTNLLYWLQLGNVFASFFFMTLASCITIVFIVKSRQRLKTLVNGKARKSQVRDIKFAITSISLNLFFLLTNAPVPLFSLLDNFIISPDIDPDLDLFLFNFSVFLFYAYFVFSFYVQLFVNSLVRSEFYKLFGRHAAAGGRKNYGAGQIGTNTGRPNTLKTAIT